jgi:hypothetical protein
MVDNMFQSQIIYIQVFNPIFMGLFFLTAGYCLSRGRIKPNCGFPVCVGRVSSRKFVLVNNY